MREIVILRDGGCVCPAPEKGHTTILQAGHLIPSVKGGVRFDLWNVHCQCSGCNGRHARPSNTHYYTDWFTQKFGLNAYHELCSRSNGKYGLKSQELIELEGQLRLILSKTELDVKWKPYFTQQEILSGEWRLK